MSVSSSRPTENSASSGFGSGSAFGVQTPLAGGGLFGGGASGTTGSTGGGLFGSVGGTGFGQMPSAGGFSFGGNTTSNTGALFGGTSQANTATSSLFSSPAGSTGFGTRPGGFTGQMGSSLIGTNTGGTSSLFRQISATGVFGGTSTSIAAFGTNIPFNPPNGQDTMMKSGVTMNINTKHKCITAMKEYENKSLEELRMEDYSANRKSKQAGSTGTVGLFNQMPSTRPSTGFVFGSGLGSGLQRSTTGFGTFGGNMTSNTGGLFGGTSQANTATSSLFSSPAGSTGFGTRPGGFTGQMGSSLIGTNTGGTSSLFRQISATGVFGGTSTSIAAFGTNIPFNPPNGQDTMMKSGVTMNINTKHKCITAMKEYENKSLEELRMEDYSANRKSKQAGSTGTVGLFNQMPSTRPSTGFVFGSGLGSGLQRSTTGFGTFGGNTTSKTGGLLDGTSQANTATSSLFSSPAGSTGFGTRPGGFTGFGTSTGQMGISLFGTNTGGTSSLFDQTSAFGMFGGAIARIAAVGTTIQFNPLNGQETMMEYEVTMHIKTKHQCNSAMKEYENKRLEKLRMEGYSANRKSKQAGSTGAVGLFGQTASTQPSTGFVFGGGSGSGLQMSTTGFERASPGRCTTQVHGVYSNDVFSIMPSTGDDDDDDDDL